MENKEKLVELFEDILNDNNIIKEEDKKQMTEIKTEKQLLKG